MEKNSIISKISKYMFIEQLTWSAWFIGIITIVYIGLNTVSAFIELELMITGNLIQFTAGASVIYMFVTGIMSGATFLPFLLKRGITRTHYFIGTVISSLGLSVTLPLIFIGFSIIEYFIYQFFNITLYSESPNIIYWFIIVFTYSINIFVSYIIGWLINLGYYRFNWIIGLGFIALSLILFSIHTAVWENSINGIFSNNINFLNSNNTLVIQGNIIPTIVSLGIIAITLVIIRLITKNVPIKL